MTIQTDPLQNGYVLESTETPIRSYAERVLTNLDNERKLADILQRSEDIIKTVDAFSDNRLNGETYDVIRMYYIYKAEKSAESDLKAYLSDLLESYTTDPRVNESINMEELWGFFSDMEIVEDVSKKVTSKGFVDRNLGGGPSALSLLESMRENPDMYFLSKNHEEFAKIRPSIGELADLSPELSALSILLSAAEAVYDLDQYDGSDKVEKFLKVLRAEALSYPLDPMGFLGLDMLISSSASLARHELAGHIDRSTDEPFFIDEEGHQKVNWYSIAKKSIEEAKEVGLHSLLQLIFGETGADRKIFSVDHKGDDVEKIYFTEISLDRDTLKPNGKQKTRPVARIIARVKGVGSWVRKKLEDEDYKNESSLPNDVVALTAILPGEEELGKMFAEYTDKLIELSTSKDIELVPAPSKDSALYVQGTPEYIENITKGLGDRAKSMLQIKMIEGDPNDIYQVAKITFNYDTRVGHKPFIIPCEFQFQTTKDRDRARLGSTAHFIYRVKSSMEIPMSEVELNKLYEDISTMNQYKKEFNAGKHFSKSHAARGEKLMSEFHSASG